MRKKLKAIKKKNQFRFGIILKKMLEVKEEPNRYKHLRYTMKKFQRVHVDSHFVLIFRIDNDDIVVFEDIEHHDVVYRR
ncbi:MAG: hypothetical protein KKG59_07120 [Nanoarchaeota archaeon]|nr:hypothetical protein [Nanoarchaeota archaeon]